MEKKRAVYEVDGWRFPVIVRKEYLTEGRCQIQLDWNSMRAVFPGKSYEEVFDLFLQVTGRGETGFWDFADHSAYFFTAPLRGVTYIGSPKLERRAEPSTHEKLSARLTELQAEFEAEGMTLVRVDHSVDMNEGSITLNYRKDVAQ